MDEKILKLFADVGPHAKEALESYIKLQWYKFFASYGAIFLTIFGLIFLIRYSYKSNK